MPNWKKLIVSGSDATLNSLNVTNAVTASAFRSTNGTGTPTLTSANSVIISGSEALILKDLALRLEAFTNAQTSSLTSQDGDIIYNSDRNKILFFTGSEWRHVLVQGDSADGFPYTGSASISGSLNVNGPITGSLISGDGSGLFNLTYDQAATVVSSFSNVVSTQVTHNFNSKNISVSVYDLNDEQLIPAKVKLVDKNNTLIQFAETSSGHISVMRGGHIVSGTIEYAISSSYAITSSYIDPTFISASAAAQGFGQGGVTSITGGTGINVNQSTGDVIISATGGGGTGEGFPYTGSAEISGSLTVDGVISGDGSGITNIDVAQLTTLQDNFVEAVEKVITNPFDTDNLNVTVYDQNGYVIHPDTIRVTAAEIRVTFASPTTGRIVVTKGGHIVSGSYNLSGTYEDTFSNATSHLSIHNFNTKNVLVQVYNDSDDVIIPSSINTPDVNSVRVRFPEQVSGRVVIAKGGHLISGSGGSSSGGSSEILMHPQTLTNDITIPDYYNAHLIGPVNIDMELTVGDQSVLNILDY